jgi:hypothetical protein
MSPVEARAMTTPDMMDVLSLDPQSLMAKALVSVMRPVIEYGHRTITSHWHLPSRMAQVNRAWEKVRSELYDVGLLYAPEDDEDGGYLDQIELIIADLPSLGEAGYVFERVGWFTQLVGYEEGVIYLPTDLPNEAYVPGSTIADVIRHEYAHAWHWLEPEFFERPWFRKAFHGEYEDGSVTPLRRFSDGISLRDRRQFERCRNEREELALTKRMFDNEFVSEYAGTHFCEDFAETFMVYLRHRKNLSRFAGRKGVYRKLLAVQAAVAQARKELGS